jgi:hypothetical protein
MSRVTESFKRFSAPQSFSAASCEGCECFFEPASKEKSHAPVSHAPLAQQGIEQLCADSDEKLNGAIVANSERAKTAAENFLRAKLGQSRFES